MIVSRDKYVELKRTGRVRGGDPEATASEPTLYTDTNNTEWVLTVLSPAANATATNYSALNRHERRAAARARARKSRQRH